MASRSIYEGILAISDLFGVIAALWVFLALFIGWWAFAAGFGLALISAGLFFLAQKFAPNYHQDNQNETDEI